MAAICVIDVESKASHAMASTPVNFSFPMGIDVGNGVVVQNPTVLY